MEIVKESLKSSHINYEKLVEYAKGIAICCNGEYGEVFYNEKQQHVFVCLGDSTPFDPEDLKEYMKDAIVDNWKDREEIQITVENECYPRDDEEGWKKIN